MFSGTGLELIGIQKSTRQQFSYVLIGTNLVDWNTALKVCESQGARLISLETASKETDLIGFLASKGKFQFFFENYEGRMLPHAIVLQ